MKTKNSIWLGCIILTCSHVLTAQTGMVSAGGEGSGSGGTFSFTTGQTDFMFYHSAAGSLQFGLQQVFFFESDVPEFRFLTDNDLIQGEAQCFGAKQTIVLAGNGNTFIVDAGTGVTLIAGKSIRMLPGTMVKQGAYLHAHISTNGFYCPTGSKSLLAIDENENPHDDVIEFPIPEKVTTDAGELFFRVYPNPTQGELTVELTAADLIEQPATIEIFSMRGELVMRTANVVAFPHHINLHANKPGLYIVRIYHGIEIGTERIIKR